ncbi:hypothetical protein [Pseudoalteromonas aurantia]|uniref:Lipoprotein n=1 Tax=Pseudoalteromonas aurantia 208 TaxID=1314867 RepID=A0ABR9EAI0_9GAMM|nr:hypothetical protein [Pseudoalteromonas aurantia]MBE0367772.1 hypothetical protein [Pseudoalteromonas aurantia 208]
MKFTYLLPAAILAASSCSFNVMSAPDIVLNTPLENTPVAHDQEAAFNSIVEFENADKGGQSAEAYERCRPTVYTRYTSVRMGDNRTIASFTHDGGNCRRYSFGIMRNYDGHDFKVTLVDSDGKKVAGGYSVAVSKSIFQAGKYYWQVENRTTAGSKTYGGMTYEVRSGG